MKDMISARWLANPCQGHSFFSHNFWSSYQNPIHHKSEDSHAR